MMALLLLKNVKVKNMTENDTSKTNPVKNKIVPTPVENKTYKPDPLYVAVYLFSNTGEPVSHHRVYRSTYKRMVLIHHAVNDFYYKHQLEGQNTKKLTMTKLSTICGMPLSSVHSTCKQMCSLQSLMKHEGDKWVVMHSHPLLIIQQKAKYSDRRFWGRKTPQYIFPYSKYAELLKKTPQNAKTI